MIIADGTPEAVIFYLYSALRYQGPTSQPYAQRLENKKGEIIICDFPFPHFDLPLYPILWTNFDILKFIVGCEAWGGGGGGGKKKQKNKKF